MSRNRKSKENVVRGATLPLSVPYTTDLQERARLTHSVQEIIGRFVAELLTNGEPLGMLVSVQKVTKLAKDERLLVGIAWWRAEPPHDIQVFKDVLFLTRCIECGDYRKGAEAHVCRSNPSNILSAPSPDPSPGGARYSATSELVPPPGHETDAAS